MELLPLLSITKLWKVALPMVCDPLPLKVIVVPVPPTKAPPDTIRSPRISKSLSRVTVPVPLLVKLFTKKPAGMLVIVPLTSLKTTLSPAEGGVFQFDATVQSPPPASCQVLTDCAESEEVAKSNIISNERKHKRFRIVVVRVMLMNH